MKDMRVLTMFMLLLLFGGITGVCPSGCKGDKHSSTVQDTEDSIVYDMETKYEENGCKEDDDEFISSESHWQSPVVPQFVRKLNPNGDWSADTICVIDGKAFYLAYDNCMNTVYSEDGILATDPTLIVLPHNKEKNIFHVSVVGKDLLVDFADKESRKQMATLLHHLPGFKTYNQHITADFCERVSFDIAVDFPKRTIVNCDDITKWFIRKIEGTEDMHGVGIH